MNIKDMTSKRNDNGKPNVDVDKQKENGGNKNFDSRIRIADLTSLTTSTKAGYYSYDPKFVGYTENGLSATENNTLSETFNDYVLTDRDKIDVTKSSPTFETGLDGHVISTHKMKPTLSVCDIECHRGAANEITVMDVKTSSYSLNESVVEQINGATNSSKDILTLVNKDILTLVNKDDGNNFNNRNVSKSTLSLDEETVTIEAALPKTTYSKSAENILMVESIPESKLSNVLTDFNMENITTQFTNHKMKISATHTIVPETVQAVHIDTKQLRPPKEILAQDIGSIVKNVHGILSSVSGSLKNAYNHSHKSTAQKSVMNVINTKPTYKEKTVNDTNDNKISQSIQEHLNLKYSSAVVDNESIFDDFRDSFESVPKLTSHEKYETWQLQMEKLVSELKKENLSLQEQLHIQIKDQQTKESIFKEMEHKLDLMCKRMEQAEKEKDAAVMRYASAECAAIEARRQAEISVRAERNLSAEVELLNSKLKSAFNEKQRICQLYDDKNHELINTERELVKIREEMRELEGKLKWTQTKLRMEMEAYKESAERAEKLSQQLTELETAKEVYAANVNDSAKAKQLEGELKESQAALILCRHEKAELDKRLTSTVQQLETYKKELEETTSALILSNKQLEKLKENNLRLEEEAAELAAMRAQAALADTLSTQLKRESERALQAEEALRVERARAETCAQREASALEHAANVTAQHVAQRALANDHSAKIQALSIDNSSLRERVVELEAERTRLQTALADETDRRNKENKILARKVAELTEELDKVNKDLEWEQGENAVLKRKHSTAIKELNRELQRTLKRCEQLEAKTTPVDDASTRAGSISSLSSSESVVHEDSQVLHVGQDALPDIQIKQGSLLDHIFKKPSGPDRQTLIERIVSLQRAGARRAERCEFLEEHTRHLTSELRNKTRLLRHLLCELRVGALAPPHADKHKSERAKLGGVMSAVWGGASGGMTLPLSLEINNKLQALLEDTLLKNITLKENMDTLSEEVARLKEQISTIEPK